jgi:5-formyltetrahydrofolate cyclo-ligase
MTIPLPRLRRQLRAARRALPPAEQRRHADAVAARLAGTWQMRRARHIALYLPTDGELDPRPLVRRLSSRGRRWYLPVLRRHAAGRLWFVRWNPGERLQRNRFGLLEPCRRRHRILSPRVLDLILTPLVGFDADGHRIGMGGGYYDRSLALLHRDHHWHRPRLVGLAHECQRVARITPRPWDLTLDAIVTERAIQQGKSPLNPATWAPGSRPRSQPQRRCW